MSTGDPHDEAIDAADAPRDPARRSFISTMGTFGERAQGDVHRHRPSAPSLPLIAEPSADHRQLDTADNDKR